MANDWVVESIIENGVDVTPTSGLEDYEMTINKDGTYRNMGIDGKWEFSSNKEDVIFDKGETFEMQFKILKLKSKELWLKDKSSSDDNEIHYKQK